MMKLKRNKLRTIKRPQTKKHILSVSKLVKLVNQITQASTSNL